MSAAHVRRGATGRAKPRKATKVAVPKKFAKRLPVDQARANKVAGLVFAAFLLAIGLVVLVALDIPAKAERNPAAFEEFRAGLSERPGYRWVEDTYRRHRVGEHDRAGETAKASARS